MIPRCWRALFVASLVAVRAAAQQPTVPPPNAPDTRPTIAVFDFANGAVSGNAEYATLTRALCDMLGQELARNPALRVVERERLQKALSEQAFDTTSQVDPATAVRIGKLLGAHHLLLGGFAILPKDERTRLWVHAVNTETAQFEYGETVDGKAERIFDLIDELGRKVSAGLKLPAMPARAPGNVGRTPHGHEWLDALALLGRGLEAQDKGDVRAAAELYRHAIDAYPDFERPKVRLAALESAKKPGQTP